MKKTLLSLLLIICSLVSAQAQTQWKLTYDLKFRQLFHNREFDYSLDTVALSGTLNRVRLTPFVGVDATTEKTSHSLRAGFDFEYDIGTKDLRSVPKELLLYYDFRAKTGAGTLGITAGLFPRTQSCVEYTTAIFSHETTLTDHVLEGILINYSTGSFYAELLCDWLEDYGDNNRERFQIVSGGKVTLLPWAAVGWQGSFFHYANYIIIPGETGRPGVADNHILYPYITFMLNGTRNNTLALTAGPMLSYQWERRQQDAPAITAGVESKLVYTCPVWNISNTVYAGQDMQPLWNYKDKNGDTYADALYFGEPFYKRFHDVLSVEWTPRITSFLNIRLGARAYFTKDGFAGWTQTFTMCFDLESLTRRH